MKTLPERPNLDFLAREAERLKSRHRRGDTGICRTVGHFDTSLHGLSDRQILERRFSILDAQRVVARQYGFASWRRLKRFVERCRAGREPADPSLERFVHRRHDELAALQADLRHRTENRKAVYERYRWLAHDSTDVLRSAYECHGWPGPDVLGKIGTDAFLHLAANVIYDADFQARTLDVLDAALPEGGIPEYQFASLKDRHLTLSKRPTVYGTPFGCYRDEAGQFELLLDPVIDPANLDRRRARVGYDSMQAQYVRIAAEAVAENWDLASRQQQIDEANELSMRGGYTGAS